MTTHHGDFIWYELMTPDSAASQAFYGPMLGWTFGGSAEYREIQGSEGGVGGLLQLTSEMTAGGAHPGWVGYILVDDVDKMVESVEQGGGQVHMPPRDIPEIGRMAMVADAQGAPIYVMKPTPPADNPDATSIAFSGDKPRIGHCAWNELATSDPQAALHFYGVRFGWVKDGEMDMGPIGTYHFIRHGEMIGAIMPLPPHVPASGWNHYFRVTDIDAAAATITATGGTVLHGPIEVPGGDWSMNAMDPQGASFGLVGKKS
jgi:uncharacterized protein